jgi:dihydropteroate synthase
MADLAPRKSFTFKARDWTLKLGTRTAVMGILNVTPDSFSDKGRYFAPEAAVDRAWRIAEEGADILDIGGESTRPGSLGVSVEEELRRVMPVLGALAKGKKYPIPISVDTSKEEVARAALECGAAMINDITSLRKAPAIGFEAARHGAGLILMHMRGEPANMQTIPPSADILKDIEAWSKEAVARAQNSGVSSDHVVLDPGIGFGKTGAQESGPVGRCRIPYSGGHIAKIVYRFNNKKARRRVGFRNRSHCFCIYYFWCSYSTRARRCGDSGSRGRHGCYRSAGKIDVARCIIRLQVV